MLEILKNIIEALKKLKPEYQIIILILALAVIYLATNLRSDAKISSDFVLSQLKNCEERLTKCEMDRINDNISFKIELQNINDKWNIKLDSLALRFFNQRLEIETIKKQNN